MEAKPNESLPSDEWLKSIGVLKNRTDEIDNLVQRAKAKKITLLREQGFAEHQNGNYDDAVEIFKTANALEKEKSFITNKTRTSSGTNMQGKVSRRIQNSTAQGKKERVVVFTGQPLFGLSKIEKGTMLKGADDCSPRIKRQLLPKVSPRVIDTPADGPSFFSRSATDRGKYRKYLLEVQRAAVSSANKQKKQKRKQKSGNIPGTFSQMAEMKEATKRREMQKLYITNGNGVNNDGRMNFYDDSQLDRMGSNSKGSQMRRYRHRFDRRSNKRNMDKKILLIPSVSRLEQSSKEVVRSAMKDESLILKNEK